MLSQHLTTAQALAGWVHAGLSTAFLACHRRLSCDVRASGYNHVRRVAGSSGRLHPCDGGIPRFLYLRNNPFRAVWCLRGVRWSRVITAANEPSRDHCGVLVALRAAYRRHSRRLYSADNLQSAQS